MRRWILPCKGDNRDERRSWVGLEGFTYSHLMRIMEYPRMASGLAREGEYGWDGWLGCWQIWILDTI
ncbi:MAG: hypothetical protein ACLU9Q_09065 [Marvinbryantia sp.]|uniref:hypothetical protein n=1 Tax=Marvinbryantia sp. TaxID=2496532 RepID=UPI0025D9A742|nr:hypothetical protein [uncultured Marvinbryantia sp.]